MSFVGGDVSKVSVAFFVSGRLCHVPNTRRGLRRFLESLEPGSSVFLESTGRYHLLACRLCFELGIPVYVANPREFSYYRRSVEFRLKSDASDAEVLARFGEKEHDRLVRWLPPSPRHALAQALLRHRALLVKCRSALALSLQSGLAFPPSEEAVRALGEAVDEAERVLVGLMREEPGYARLLEIPGVGPLTACAMVLAFSKGPFPSADRFVAFLGLDLRFSDSGQRTGRRRLSKRGDPLSRCLLYTAASSGVRTAAWKPFYERHLAKGMARVQALVAVARKMARVVWSILSKDTEFDQNLLART